MNFPSNSASFGLASFLTCLGRPAAMAAALAFGGTLHAQNDGLPDLEQWASVGAAPAIENGRSLTIAAGAQLFHTADAVAVSVRMVSRPVFAAVPSEWATLEIGPASLTFVRDSAGGGLVLLADAPLALPFDLSLDAGGRSTLPLDFILSYDQSTGTAKLAIQNESFDVEASAPRGPIEVALSAGRRAAWTIDTLELTAVTRPEVDGNPSGSAEESITGMRGVSAPDSGLRMSPAERAQARKQKVSAARGLFMEEDNEAAERALTDANRNPRNTPEWHLESANELVHMAYSFARMGRPQKAVQISRRALEHTDRAVRKAARQEGRAPLAAAAEELAAFIHETLLADYSGAKAFYERAALRYPRGQSNRELERLDRIEREADRKAGVPAK